MEDDQIMPAFEVLPEQLPRLNEMCRKFHVPSTPGYENILGALSMNGVEGVEGVTIMTGIGTRALV